MAADRVAARADGVPAGARPRREGDRPGAAARSSSPPGARAGAGAVAARSATGATARTPGAVLPPPSIRRRSPARRAAPRASGAGRRERAAEPRAAARRAPRARAARARRGDRACSTARRRRSGARDVVERAQRLPAGPPARCRARRGACRRPSSETPRGGAAFPGSAPGAERLRDALARAEQARGDRRLARVEQRRPPPCTRGRRRRPRRARGGSRPAARRSPRTARAPPSAACRQAACRAARRRRLDLVERRDLLRAARARAPRQQERVAQRAHEVGELVLPVQPARLREHARGRLLHQVLRLLARAAQRPRHAVEAVEVRHERLWVEARHPSRRYRAERVREPPSASGMMGSMSSHPTHGSDDATDARSAERRTRGVAIGDPRARSRCCSRSSTSRT